MEEGIFYLLMQCRTRICLLKTNAPGKPEVTPIRQNNSPFLVVCGYSPVHSLPRDTPRTGSLKCAHWKRTAERAKRSKFGVLPEDAPEALDATVQIVADDEETGRLRGEAFSAVRANALLAAIDKQTNVGMAYRARVFIA